MKKLRGRKEFNLVLLLLPLWLEAAVSEKSKDKELIIVETSVQEYTTDEGQLDTSYAVDTTRLDVTGWEPGEEFVQLGSYSYPWQGEEIIDYKLEDGLLWVNGKLVGINLSEVDSLITYDPGEITTAVAYSWNASELQGFKNLLALEAYGLNDEDLSNLKELTSVRFLALKRSYWSSLKDIITDKGLKQLKYLKSLRELDLSGAKLSDKGLRYISRFSHLKVLKLSGSLITSSGTRRLSGLSELGVLDLSYTSVDDNLWRHLKDWEDLRELNVSGTAVTGSELTYLGELRGLESLDLSFTMFNDSGLSYLSESKFCNNLKELDLWGTRITDEGLVWLQGFPQLRQLDIGGTGITDTGLAKISGLTDLEELGLSCTGITDAALGYLFSLGNLRMLDTKETAITDSGLVQLDSVLPRYQYLGSGFTLVGDLSNSDIVQVEMPVYPKWAKKNRLGRVYMRMRIAVNPYGRVVPWMVIEKSTGYPQWDNEIIESLMDWRFKPAKTHKNRSGTITFNVQLL